MGTTGQAGGGKEEEKGFLRWRKKGGNFSRREQGKRFLR